MKYIEKKNKFEHFDSTKIPKYYLSIRASNIQPASKIIPSYASGATDPKLIILRPYRKLLK